MQTKSLEGALTLTLALTWVSGTASKTGKNLRSQRRLQIGPLAL